MRTGTGKGKKENYEHNTEWITKKLSPCFISPCPVSRSLFHVSLTSQLHSLHIRFFSFRSFPSLLISIDHQGWLDWSKKLSLDLLTSLADEARSGWTCSVREGPDFIPTALLTRKTNKLISKKKNNNNKTARRRNKILRDNSQESSFLQISLPQKS